MKYSIALVLLIVSLFFVGCASELPPEPNAPGATGNYYRAIGSWATNSSTFFVDGPDRINCTPGQQVAFKLAVDGDQYVYKSFYIWNEDEKKWDVGEWNGSKIPNSNWISGRAEFNNQETCEGMLDAADNNSEIFSVAYSCSRAYDGTWDCHNNKWQLEILSVTNGSSNISYCYDSDGGFEPNVYGYLNQSFNQIPHADYCMNDNLSVNEWSCVGNDTFRFDEYICPFGCANGACLPSPLDPQNPGNLTNQTCVDSDFGLNYYANGTAYGLFGGEMSSFSDSCCSGDSCSSSTGDRVLETSCDGAYIRTQQYSCPNGCANGACINLTTTITCFDTDAGINYYRKGNVTLTSCTSGGQGGGCGQSTATDYCTSTPVVGVAEYYCDIAHNQTAVDYYACPNGCSNGACVPRGTALNACQDITVPGEYYLNRSVSALGYNTNCFNINTNGVILNGNGYSIIANVTGSQGAVSITNKRNISVIGVIISGNFLYGVAALNSSLLNISNVVKQQGEYVVAFRYVNNSAISNSIGYLGTAYSIRESFNNILRNNTGYVYQYDGSANNTVLS